MYLTPSPLKFIAHFVLKCVPIHNYVPDDKLALHTYTRTRNLHDCVPRLYFIVLSFTEKEGISSSYIIRNTIFL